MTDRTRYCSQCIDLMDEVDDLRKEIDRLRQCLIDAVEIINDQMPGEYPDWEIYAKDALREAGYRAE